MAREKKHTASQKQKNRSGSPERYDHLSGFHLTAPPAETVFEVFRARMRHFIIKARKKGRERLTIMVIPHTEKKIFNIHTSVFGITAVSVAVSIVMIISIMSLVGKSGEDIEFYDMGLTNSQFNLQSVKMSDEMLPVHELINQYSNTIAEIYTRIEGGSTHGQGGEAQAIVDREVEDLRSLTDECKALGDACGQDKTEQILRKLTYLSKQDNESLRQAIELSDRIISELNTREKQNLLKNTPGIWPTNGYILSPYGEQTDPVLGRKVFKNGIEIGSFAGSEVYATAEGEVSQISYDGIYGLSVWIAHRYGIRTFYSHLGRITVAPGDRVGRGQVIGYVGKSGSSPLHMLYYEVHVGTAAFNPHAFLNHLQDEWLIQPKL